ncbi:non-heme iron oxygenase ferredoxin subunit [Tardiphaga alba]|uniref:Non-heme iron oxygenase ferredoxin subunit n=1 Tax=Tardiphaga alba TaxID=340268 RepID=A0ABX8AE60_9BRAD|nr:non-heme iron oxygenase ferredoxin subunit [Tardiphaga alba]QUS41953.1 non-heme iron oxygenase ferredoxin subunit [Tardiphaga alba]
MSDGWLKAADLDDVVDGEPFACEIAGTKLALYSLDGCIFATSNICSHAYALLSDGLIEGDAIECPLHNARFDIRTGKALTSPAEKDIATYLTKVEGNAVFVRISD